MGDPKDINTIETDAEANSIMSLKILNSWDEKANVFDVYNNGKGQELIYADLSDAVKESEASVKYKRIIASPDGIIFLDDNMENQPLTEERIRDLVKIIRWKKEHKENIKVDTKIKSKGILNQGTEDFYSFKLSYYPHGLIGLQVRDLVKGRSNAKELKSLIELQSQININKKKKGKD